MESRMAVYEAFALCSFLLWTRLRSEVKIQVLLCRTTAASDRVPCNFLEDNISSQMQAHMASPSAGSWKPVT